MASEFLIRIIRLIFWIKKQDQAFLIAWWIIGQNNVRFLLLIPLSWRQVESKDDSWKRHEEHWPDRVKILTGEFNVRVTGCEPFHRTEDRSNSIKINEQRKAPIEVLMRFLLVSSSIILNCSVGTLLQSTVHRTIYVPKMKDNVLISDRDTDNPSG